MQIIGGQSNDPSQNGGVGSFSAGVAAAGGQVILHNLSTYDVLLTFGTQGDMQRQAILHAWQQRQFDFCGKATPLIYYSVPIPPSAALTSTAPSSFIWGEAFAPGEVPPLSLPNYDRLSNVGNTVTTQGGSANVKNDNNAPGTTIIEATPSDQGQSSLNLANDGSGIWKILSAGVLRIFMSLVRGNATSVKAALQIGDSGDTSILTLFATLGAGSVVPLATLSAGALPAGITLPVAQLTGNVPASQVAAGTFGTGKFLFVSPANGSGNPDTLILLNGDETQSLNFGVSKAGDALNAPGGYIWDTVKAHFLAQAGLLLPGAMGAGSLATSVYTGTTAAGQQFMGFGQMNGTGTTSGIQAAGEIDIAGSSGGVMLKLNNYWDGTNDRYMDSAGSAIQIIMRHDLNTIAPVIRVANSPVAGGIISWSPFSAIAALKTVGGGAAGQSIWVGTTDPGASANEGDIWIQQ